MRTSAGPVSLRPVKLRDATTWSRLRLANQGTLQPWEPTAYEGWEARNGVSGWASTYTALRTEARRGTMLPFAIEAGGRYVGQLTIGTIQRGALRNAWIGYWVDEEVTGRGIATAAVALGIDHAFGPCRLHRLEATVQPANGASRTVLERNGFRREGLLERYMDIDGQWRDHDLFGLTVDEVDGSAVSRIVRAGHARY